MRRPAYGFAPRRGGGVGRNRIHADWWSLFPCHEQRVSSAQRAWRSALLISSNSVSSHPKHEDYWPPMNADRRRGSAPSSPASATLSTPGAITNASGIATVIASANSADERRSEGLYWLAD